MVLQGILQGIMLPTNVTFKVIDRSPGSCKIFPVYQDQILYIVCGQGLFVSVNIREIITSLKAGKNLRFVAVNIPHGFKVYEIIFHFLPVWSMVILKMCIPVYLCIEEIAVLHGIAKHIFIIACLPFICLYALLPVNGNRIFGLLDIMSRGILPIHCL